jgi:hypothetical protein
LAQFLKENYIDKGRGRVPRPDDVGALVRARAYRPFYPE